jgi:hypothetical protein
MKDKCLISICVLFFMFVSLGELFGAQYFPEEIDIPATLKSLETQLFSGVLESIGEPALWQLAEDRNVVSYRFMYLQSRGEPVVLRLDRSSEKAWILTVKQVSSSSKSKLAVNRKVDLPQVKFVKFRKLFDALDFWKLPTVGAVEQEINLFGGTYCILESVENGHYHLVVRRSPKDSDERWVSDPNMAKEFQKLKEDGGFPDIDRATSGETSRKLLAVCEYLMSLSSLKIKVH